MNTIYVQSVDDEEKWSPTVYKPRFKWLTRCLVTCKRSTDTTNYFIDEKKNDGNNIFFLNAFTFVVTPDRKVQAKVRAQVSQHMHTKPYNLLFGKVDTCQKLANQFSS